MQRRKVNHFLFLLLLLLTGCTGSSKSHAAIPVLSQVQIDKSNHYAAQIKQAIEEKFPYAARYRGQKCTVSLKIARDGLLVEVKTLSGDPELCREAVSAVTRAKFPPAPDDATAQTLKSSVLEFAP